MLLHNSRAFAAMATVLVVLPHGGCGSGLPHSGSVTVRVTPAQATVHAAGRVALVGDATGFTRSPIVTWWVQEAHTPGSDDCGYLNLPPVSQCPFGYVVFGSVTQFPSSATYYAPQTAGTYHVTFQATQNTAFDYLSKTAEATITVTP